MSIAARALVSACVAAVIVMNAAPAWAQFGIGGRIAMVKTDAPTDEDEDSVRFTGGHIRLGMSSRTGLEVSLDRRTETFDLLDERVKETPIQVSLLMFLAGGGFKPYLLGGPGWYSRKVESLSDAGEEPVSTRKFGWHGGFGAELRMGRHAGLHADYRYTFLDFTDDDEGDDSSFVSRVFPSHGGSMWTVGATVYF
ncbi:MAG TPA: outer membrane beta-barrel protein [Vicinamibacterales bacterium]|jgi:hypothetical protein